MHQAALLGLALVLLLAPESASARLGAAWLKQSTASRLLQTAGPSQAVPSRKLQASREQTNHAIRQAATSAAASYQDSIEDFIDLDDNTVDAPAASNRGVSVTVTVTATSSSGDLIAVWERSTSYGLERSADDESDILEVAAELAVSLEAADAVDRLDDSMYIYDDSVNDFNSLLEEEELESQERGESQGPLPAQSGVQSVAASR